MEKENKEKKLKLLLKKLAEDFTCKKWEHTRYNYGLPIGKNVGHTLNDWIKSKE